MPRLWLCSYFNTAEIQAATGMVLSSPTPTCAYSYPLACLKMQTMHLQTQVRRLIQLKTHQLGGRQEERSVFLYLFCNLTAFVCLVYLGWNNPILCCVWKAEWKCKGIQALV